MCLIIEDERPFYPDLRERIKVGDELLVVTPENQRENTEDCLRTVGQRGRLARWRPRDGLRMSSAVRRCRDGYACRCLPCLAQGT